jgi:hypothetical protein
VVGEEDSTAAVAEHFMEAAEQRSTEVEVLAAESTLGSSADARTADIVAAITEVAAVTAGVAGIGAGDTVTDGAGDLALDGRIGVGAGDILIPTTAPGITGLALIIRTRITVLRTILRAIPIRATGTTIHRQPIQTGGPCPTRTGRQDPGDHRYREAERIQTTQTATPRPSRRVGRFSLLTG